MPSGHGGGLLDDGPRARVGRDRKPVLNRILSGARGEVVDAAFHRENIRHGAEPAQRRGAHRRFRHEVMQHALGRNVVKRLAIARTAAAVCLGHVIRRRLGRRIGQGKRAEQIAARAGAQIVRRAPDLLRPVDGLAGVVEQRHGP